TARSHAMPAHLLPVSRRRFLAASASAIAGLGHSDLLGSDSQVNPNSWALISDTHLLSQRSIDQHYDNNRTAMEKRATLVATNFERAARQVLASAERPAGLVLSGDCVHVGGKEEYELLARKLKLLDTIPIHVAMGNHDHRDNFSNVFREQTQSDDRLLLENRHVSVLKSQHANLVLLDSLTMQTPDRPVKGPGRLGKEQLAWFEAVLDSESDKPAVVVLHHNVNPSDEYRQRTGQENFIVPSADPFRGFTGGLEDTDRFLALLHARPHVKAVVFGHMHQFQIFKSRNVFFVSMPPVGYTFGPQEAVGWIRMLLKDNGATLEVQTLDTKHVRHQKRVDLRWS
ncbi:MAG: metallophosphoesterase, partial [Pirellulaceae bacterium]|nr:metallophosphoesterase [Pirellulaceae bacterium]